jgi:flagellar biosynthesis/type III secretory pathway protein FliH
MTTRCDELAEAAKEALDEAYRKGFNDALSEAAALGESVSPEPLPAPHAIDQLVRAKDGMDAAYHRLDRRWAHAANMLSVAPDIDLDEFLAMPAVSPEPPRGGSA